MPPVKPNGSIGPIRIESQERLKKAQFLSFIPPMESLYKGYQHGNLHNIIQIKGIKAIQRNSYQDLVNNILG